MSSKILLTILILCSLKLLINSELFESPCPNLFKYTGHSKNASEWHGKVVLLSSTDLFDVWIQLTFDKPFLKLENAFGEVVTNGSDGFIEKPNFKLQANTPHTFSFILKYRPNEPPPMLVSYKLNGILVCFKTPQLKEPSLDHICGTVTQHSEPQKVNNGMFPWHALLYHAKGIDLAYICGASLISTHHVITVANCVTKTKSKNALNPDDLVVYLGKYSFKQLSNPGIQYREVSQIIVHPQYNAKNYNNNVALVKFKNPAEITNYVRPVCLWQKSPDLSSVLNKQGNVVGWAFDLTGKIREMLTQIIMPVVSQEMCVSSFPSFYSRFTSNNTYCAGFRNETSVCNGDAGNSMVFARSSPKPNNLVWQLGGLLSITIALENEPNKLLCFVVFTDAAKYLEWVKTAMTI